jgi:hypothetical protein
MIGGFVPDTQPEVIADSVKKNLTQGLVDTQTAANQAYSTLRGVGKLNVATDPITGNAIEGPVSTPRTAKVVYDYVLNLAKQAKMSPYEYVQSLQAKGEPLAGTFSDIINAVRKAPDGTPLRIIRNGQLVGYQTNPVGIDQALSIGETAGSGANYGDTLRTFKQTQLGKFKQAMNNDIDESVSRWNNGNVTAKNALEEGRAQTAKKYNLYGGKKAPGTADLLSTTGSGEGELNRLLGDPIHLRRALAGAGDPEALRKDLAGQNLSNIFDDYQKASIGGGKTKSINEFWNDRANQATISDLYTPAERGNIEQFFKTVQTLDTKANTSGRGALFFRGGTAAVIALPTIYNAATGGDISSGAKGSLGALSIVIGLNQFSRHILLDPIAAKAATIAARSPITSAEGRLATKLTMFALRGEQVKLKMPDGTEKTATIDEKGNLVAPSN